jgi:Cu(I)/Ag(I) efflux system membrane fusion protein
LRQYYHRYKRYFLTPVRAKHDFSQRHILQFADKYFQQGYAKSVIAILFLYFCTKILDFMFNRYLIFAFCVMLFASCKDNGTETATTETKQEQVATAEKMPVQSRLSDEQNKVLVATLGSYYKLKDALVATNAAQAKDAAMELHNMSDSLYKVTGKDVAAQANANTFAPYIDTVKAQSKSITEINDATCEKQRIAFELVSRAMYGLLKNVEIKNAGVYHQYCPMAFNDKGAYWLSDVSDIKNPYFGKKMLECGEVTDSL